MVKLEFHHSTEEPLARMVTINGISVVPETNDPEIPDYIYHAINFINDCVTETFKNDCLDITSETMVKTFTRDLDKIVLDPIRSSRLMYIIGRELYRRARPVISRQVSGVMIKILERRLAEYAQTGEKDGLLASQIVEMFHNYYSTLDESPFTETENIFHTILCLATLTEIMLETHKRVHELFSPSVN